MYQRKFLKSSLRGSPFVGTPPKEVPFKRTSLGDVRLDIVFMSHKWDSMCPRIDFYRGTLSVCISSGVIIPEELNASPGRSTGPVLLYLVNLFFRREGKGLRFEPM